MWFGARKNVVFGFLLLLVLGSFLFLYNLTWDQRPIPMMGWVDDYMYVSHAQSILRGVWLGDYAANTLIKRPLFSVFLAVSSLLNLRYLPAMTALYLVSLVTVAYGLLRLGYSRTTTAVFFVVSALLPHTYDNDAIRVLRNQFALCLQILVVGIIFIKCSEPRKVRFRDLRSRYWLVLLLLIGFWWGVREEAILFYPALVFGAAFYAFYLNRGLHFREKWGTFLALCGGGTLAILLAYGTICTLNAVKYGVFLMDENTEGAFPKAMGAIAAIEEGEPDNYLINKAERAKLKQLSPTFAAIGAILDQVPDESEACRRYGKCDGPDYSHSVYFLRMSSGHEKFATYRDARFAQKVYRHLRQEVLEACQSGALHCNHPEARSLRPKFRADHLPALWKSVWTQLDRIVHLKSGIYDIRGYSKFDDGLDDRVLGIFESEAD